MLFLLLAIFGAVVAGYYDVRYRIIPNKLSFSLILIGAAGNLFLGNVKQLSISVAAMFSIGYAFWKLGLWAAGDAKEFLFLSALLPAYPQELKQVFTPYIAPYPFPITILLNTFFVSFPLVFAYALYLTIKKTKFGISAEKAKEGLRNSGSLVFSAFFTASLLVVLASFRLNSMLGTAGFYLSLLAVLFASFYLKNLKLKYAIIFSGLVFSLYSSALQVFFISAIILFTAMLLFKVFWSSVVFLSRHGLYEEVEAGNLKEGMILAEEIYFEKAGESKKSVVVGESISRRIRGGDEVIAASAARGLEKEEIEKIKKLAGEGKIGKKIKIKKSMAFAPVLFGLGISLIFGDIAAMKVLK